MVISESMWSLRVFLGGAAGELALLAFVLLLGAPAGSGPDSAEPFSGDAFMGASLGKPCNEEKHK